MFLKSHHFKDNSITHACIVDRGNGVGLEGHSENQERHPNTGRCSQLSSELSLQGLLGGLASTFRHLCKSVL